MSENSQAGAVPENRSFLERVLLGEIVSNVLAPLAFLLIMLIIVDGAVPQLEMLISGGRVPVPTLILKAGLVILMVLSAALGRHFTAELIPTGAWLAFAIYLVLDVPHLLTQHISLFVILSGYYGYYSLILLLPLVGALASRMRSSELTHALFWIFWLCAVIGIAQHVFNSPILYTESSDGSFKVISWTLFGTGLIRSFSLFVYSINFGLFCTLVGTIGFYSYMQDRLWRGLVIFGVSALCAYFTFTRVVYLVFLIGTIAVLALRLGKTARLVRLCPVLGLFVGALLAYGGTTFLTGREGIADNLSLLQRITQFAYYWSVFIGGDLRQRLFGQGYVQDSKVNGQETYPIDNLFMALLLHIGIIGLLLALFFFWALYQRISERARKNASPLSAGICAVWSSFLALSLFDISIAFFPCCAMLMILSTSPDSKSQLLVTDTTQ